MVEKNNNKIRDYIGFSQLALFSKEKKMSFGTKATNINKLDYTNQTNLYNLN